MEEMKCDLTNLRQADIHLKNALNLLKDVEDFKDEDYQTLDYMNQDIEDLIMKLENKLERMEEIA